MEKINRVTIKLEDFSGKFMTILDLWDPKGKLEMSDNSIKINGQFIAIGHPLTRIEVS